MRDNRGLIYCDVCGRQIVNIKNKQNNKYAIDGNRAIQTDINKHICRTCSTDPMVREQEGIGK